ncbi:MAG: histidine phosphatase family protein [Clostridia bacterium]|nr:histidine phosphatase family protein [Clostridia bacterium]
MKALYLIRHSITEGVERRLYYGATDLPLVESGWKLCESLRGSFDIPADVTYATTGMIRTRETLEGLFGKVPYEEFPDLREMNVGVLEMHSYEELKENPDYLNWIFDEVGDFRIPGGETKNEMSARIMRCINMLANRPGPGQVIVCHGGTICNAMTNLFPNDCKSFYDWSPKPCTGYAVFFEDGKAVSWKKI